MRQNIKEADEILGMYFPVLDNGFIALVNYMGSDEDIVRAARNSYAKGTKTVSDDKALIRRLMRDKHSSPFEFVEFTFHVRAPLYVIQQWLRHRTNNFCQESHRYSEVKDDYQKTESDKWRLQDKSNKQGSSGYLEDWPEKEISEVCEQNCFEMCCSPAYENGPGNYLSYREETLHNHLKDIYKERIELGVAREQARKDIPHSTFSSIYIKCDLHNLLHFLKLRTDPHAQEEIRAYANLIAGMVKRVAPLTFEAWVDYSYGAKSFSRLDLELLNSLQETYSDFKMNEWSNSYDTDKNDYHTKIGMKKNELEAFWKKLTPIEIPNFDLDLSSGKKEL